jgi:hypothetical protein
MAEQEPVFPEIEVRPRHSNTAAQNRQLVMKRLMAEGHPAEAVDFINEVSRVTEGRVHRHRWVSVAERYVKLHWVN